MFRFGTASAAILGCVVSAVAAFGQSPSPYVLDPYEAATPASGRMMSYGGVPWQVDPFGVGYDLLGGYRPIYSGARQPIGHEIIPTRPDGNGYVYRPVYAPSPGFHYTPSGALIVEFPARHPTVADAPFPDIENAPVYVESLPVPRSGPREF